ncbi:MAG: hypothetical protein UY72_C0031G0006 [Candidatus Uhrbacteria bacterium GW2011_GWD2_52_7]|uniref:Uncharacterized protein n=1 Tax=Candidatus Uhrbacteria bacterium GW2011_GWD2_52_7 TaxID=1618989 RepID=A0A0G2ABR9_9BACT|nr:MAG: hypothetical protein UY72_C0031G0006 [Candidatus Uhrbacteria bacterium GW2011_GWD2_52_7]
MASILTQNPPFRTGFVAWVVPVSRILSSQRISLRIAPTGTAISLAAVLLRRSWNVLRSYCERPILLLHQNGFATSPCRQGTRDVAGGRLTAGDLISLFTFHPALASRTSIVSVVLSLGLESPRCSMLAANIEKRSYTWSPLATFFGIVHCCTKGVRTFLPNRSSVRSEVG